MAAWWRPLSALGHVLLYIAVPATLILLIQTVLLSAGGTFNSDGNASVSDADGPDFDGSGADSSPLHEAVADLETSDTGLHLFTMRGVVAFPALFGWGSLWLHQVGLSGFPAIFLVIPIGFVGMVGITLAIHQALRLRHDDTLNLRNALERMGTVYLTVPPGRFSPDKITLTVQGQLTEFEALTDSPAPIPTDSPVRATGLVGHGALLVESIPSESKETEQGGAYAKHLWTCPYLRHRRHRLLPAAVPDQALQEVSLG